MERRQQAIASVLGSFPFGPKNRYFNPSHNNIIMIIII